MYNLSFFLSSDKAANAATLSLKSFCLTKLDFFDIQIPSYIEIKIKASIKPFQAPQRSVKIKIYLNFFLFVRDWDGKG